MCGYHHAKPQRSSLPTRISFSKVKLHFFARFFYMGSRASLRSHLSKLNKPAKIFSGGSLWGLFSPGGSVCQTEISKWITHRIFLSTRKPCKKVQFHFAKTAACWQARTLRIGMMTDTHQFFHLLNSVPLLEYQDGLFLANLAQKMAYFPAIHGFHQRFALLSLMHGRADQTCKHDLNVREGNFFKISQMTCETPPLCTTTCQT